jgi:uncharacterized protein
LLWQAFGLLIDEIAAAAHEAAPRGWPKDLQRMIFQPVMLAAIVVSAITLSVAGAVNIETVKLYVLGLPALLAGPWGGFKLYGKLDDAAFRKVILLLLLVSGLALIVPTSLWRLAASL